MEGQPDLRHARIRFGVFELDTETGELHKHGVRVRLQEQPLKVLLCLLETPGSLCSREALIRTIWPEGLFVDYEHGLNTAVTRLRQVLGDSADHPRYVETVDRKGYRFIAPVESVQRVEPVSSAPPSAERLEATVPQTARRRIPHWAWVLGMGVVIAAGLLWWRAAERGGNPLIRLSLELGSEMPASSAGPCNLLALAPDGSRIVLTVRGPNGKRSLAIRKLAQGRIALLPDTEGAGSPFFSPDGQWIGFFSNGKLKKIRVDGGPPVTLADAFTIPTGPGGIFPSGSWGDDGQIVAMLTQNSGLCRVHAGGGPAVRLQFARRYGDEIDRWPQVLPGSRAVLFTASGRDYENGDIDVLVLKTGERKTLHRGGFRGRYLASGHLVYIHQNTLFAAPFDLNRLALTAAPRPVLEDVADELGTGWHFDASLSGSFSYLSSRGEPRLSMFSIDRHGIVAPFPNIPAGLYGNPRFSPDGKKLAFSVKNGSGQDIWVGEIGRPTASRVTTLAGVNDSPVWTHDGQHILFRSAAHPSPGIYGVRANGAAEPKRLLDLKNEECPSSISSDGKYLAIWDMSAGGAISIATIETDGEHLHLSSPAPFRQATFEPSAPSRSRPSFSPDGRWLAYGSNESGRIEIYVSRFPGPGPKRQISTDGGVFPTWSPNGRELLYKHEPSEKIVVVGYTSSDDSFEIQEAGFWSDKPVLNGIGVHSPFDVAPDGSRIAAVMYADGTAERKPVTSVTFLLNFFDELRRSSVDGK